MTDEAKEERKTLSIEELLKITKGIEESLSKEHNLSSAEVMFVGTILQASANTDYMIHNLIKKAHVQVIAVPQENVEYTTEFKPGEN